MECISCNQKKPPNRVVVDSVEESLIGGYCRSCEEQSFGQSLRRNEWRSEEQCLLCERDGFYKLPFVRLQMETETETIETALTATLQDVEGAVELCDRHLDAMIAPDQTTPQTALEEKRSRM